MLSSDETIKRELVKGKLTPSTKSEPKKKTDTAPESKAIKLTANNAVGDEGKKKKSCC